MERWLSKSAAAAFLLGLIGGQLVTSESIYTYGTRVPGAIVHYEFPRDECKASAFSDSAPDALFGTLVRSSETRCNNGLGVSLSNFSMSGAAQVVSSQNSGAFVSRMSGAGSFSLEFWMATEDDSSDLTDRPLFTIGKVGDTTGDTCISTNTHGTYGMSVYDRESNNNMYFHFGYISQASSPYFCPVSVSSGLGSHIVVTIEEDIANNDNTLTWYVDGVLNSQLTTFGTGDMGPISSAWDTWESPYYLELFGDTQANKIPWNGEVWAMALYNRSLTASEVAQNYEAKLPDSPPVPISFRATVREDGMASAQRKDPSVYSGSGVANIDLEWVSLSASDQDESSGYPNFNASYRLHRPMEIWAASADGVRLYQYATGAELGNASTQLLPTYINEVTGEEYTQAEALLLPDGDAANLTKSYRVRVRPEGNAFSPEDASGNLVPILNFTFYAVDGVTGVQSTENATCHLAVSPMNDPPLPRNFRVFVAAGVTTTIPFNSSDVDNALPFKNAYITKYPTNGVLMPVASNGNISECLVDDPEEEGVGKSWVAVCTNPQACLRNVTDLNDTLSSNCTGAVAVAYALTNWSALSGLEGQDGIVGSDSFEFVLQDTQGYNSTPATAKIEITTPLIATAVTATVTAYEETAKLVLLSGRDESPQDRPLWVEILSLPSHGSLTDPTTNLNLNVGDYLATGLVWPNTSQVGVVYTGVKDYFNLPNTEWDGSTLAALSSDSSYNDAFSFRVVSKSDGFTSKPAAQSLTVVNVNDASEVLGPLNASSLSIYAYSAFYDNLDYDREARSHVLDLAGLSVTTADGNVDAVKVRLVCDYGKLYLNPTNISLLDFTSSTYCFNQPLLCKNAYGNGYSDIIFNGPPSAVNYALDGLTYISGESDVIDHCSVTVYDGAGGDCLPLSALRERRNGRHTTDKSGDASIYTLDGSGSGGAQCYIDTSNFTVSVGGFAALGGEERCTLLGFCIPLEYLLLAILMCCGMCCHLCSTAQRKYQAKLTERLGLGLYDADEENLEGDENSRMLLAARNKPSNWRRVRYLELTNQNKASDDSSSKASATKGIQFGAVPEDEDGISLGLDNNASSNEGMFKALANQSPHSKASGRPMAKRGSVVNGEMLFELDEVETDPDRYYYVNVVTGDAQWDAPLFTRGLPSYQDFAVCHGPENDPTTWLQVDAPGSAPYYYNTVTKRSTWIAPRFSANWMKDRERKEDSNKKKRSIFRLGFKSKQAVHRDPGSSGFQSVFGPESAVTASAASSTTNFGDNTYHQDTHSTSGSPTGGSVSKASDTPAPAGPGGSSWDGSFVRDPGVILGGWTVDGVDERAEAFEAAARALLAQSGDGDGSSSSLDVALTSVTWASLAAQADLELATLRRARVSGVLAPTKPHMDASSVPASTETATVNNPLSAAGPRRVANYGGGELRDLFTALVKRGWIEPHDSAAN